MVMYFNPLKVLMPPALWLIVDRPRQGRRRHRALPVLYFPANTVLLIVSGIMIGSLALLADLIVRSRTSV